MNDSVITKEKILQLLPHRDPFLMLDELRDAVPGESGIPTDSDGISAGKARQAAGFPSAETKGERYFRLLPENAGHPPETGDTLHMQRAAGCTESRMQETIRGVCTFPGTHTWQKSSLDTSESLEIAVVSEPMQSEIHTSPRSFSRAGMHSSNRTPYH